MKATPRRFGVSRLADNREVDPDTLDPQRFTTSTLFDEMRADYDAGKESRFLRRREWLPRQGSGADYHDRREYQALYRREWARDFARNDSIAGAIVDRACENIVQGGFQPDFDTGDPAIDQALLDMYEDWSGEGRPVDVSGEYSWSALQYQAQKQAFIDGDFWLLLHDNEMIETVEAHRIRNPHGVRQANLVQGVVIGDNRQQLAAWVTPETQDPYTVQPRVEESVGYSVWDGDGYKRVLQAHDKDRVSQTRGVTAYAPIFDELGMFEDAFFAKLLQQQIVSCFAIFRQRELGFDPSQKGATTGPVTTRDAGGENDYKQLMQGIRPGVEYVGLPGETLSGFSPNVPNPEWFEHIRTIIRVIGANIGLPLEAIIYDSTNTNFSGWRGAMDQARLSFRKRQKRLMETVHYPTTFWNIRNWMMRDRALARAARRRGVRIFHHSWNPPGWPYISPQEDATADTLVLGNNLASPRRVAQKNGWNFESLVEETVEDNARWITSAVEKAQEINARMPEGQEDIHWRELLRPSHLDRVTLNVNDQVDDPADPNQPAPTQNAQATAR